MIEPPSPYSRNHKAPHESPGSDIFQSDLIVRLILFPGQHCTGNPVASKPFQGFRIYAVPISHEGTGKKVFFPAKIRSGIRATELPFRSGFSQPAPSWRTSSAKEEKIPVSRKKGLRRNSGNSKPCHRLRKNQPLHGSNSKDPPAGAFLPPLLWKAESPSPWPLPGDPRYPDLPCNPPTGPPA